MSDRGDELKQDDAGPRDVQRAKRPYVSPQLVVYGTVAKLTQSGGISVKDFGSMKRTDT